MGNDVFANGREVSCKAADGKSMCAFPDVCFTPPENPATPPGVPIPYPNTGMAKDTTSGSKKVKVSGKEVMLKNKSYFKKSIGDEAGSAAKKGVITSTNRGKVYFNSWSMDVKFEGENVVRHLDLTTHNHMSFPGNSPTWPYVDEQAMESGESACTKGNPSDAQKIKDNCTGDPEKDCPKPESGFKENECVKAKRCALQPYDKSQTGKGGCCDPQTGHHLIPKRNFKEFEPKYKEQKAPCVCAEGTSHHRGSKRKTPDLPPSELTHADLHAGYDYLERQAQANPCPGGSKEKPFRYSEARTNAIASHAAAFPGCNPNCIKEQLDNYHNKEVGVKEDDLLTSPPTGWSGIEKILEDATNQEMVQKTLNVLQNIKQQLSAAVQTAASAF
jgi:hypothetical protein